LEPQYKTKDFPMKTSRCVSPILATLFAATIITSAAQAQPVVGPPKDAKITPLPAGALARLPSGGAVVVFAPDGKSLLMSSPTDVHSLTLWNVATRKPVRAFIGPKTPGILIGTFVGFRAAAFSADGKTLATGSSDGSLRLWDVATGRLIRDWQGHKDFVYVLDLSADGKTLVSHGWMDGDGTVKVWDTANGRLRLALPAAGRHSQIPCLSPSGKQLAVVDDAAATVTIRDSSFGEKINQFPVARVGNQVALVYHPDGKSLFVASFATEGTIRRYDVMTGKELAIVARQRDIRSISFTRDFSVVAAVTQGDRNVNFWNVASGKLHATCKADTNVWTVAVAPEGQIVATQGDSPSGVLLWEMPR
jgi:WD40 repeat protein